MTTSCHNRIAGGRIYANNPGAGGQINGDTNSNDIRIDGVEIYSAIAGYGIRMTACQRWMITNCDFHNNPNGIFVDASHNCTIANNQFISQTTNGIMINGNSGACSYNIITGNICNSNGADGVEIGGTHPPEKTVVTDNNLLFNGVAGLSDSGSNTVTDNNLT